MGNHRKIIPVIVLTLLIAPFTQIPRPVKAGEGIVYSVTTPLDMGDRSIASENRRLKDYYINVGSRDGIRPGTVLEVHRRQPSYDLRTKKLHKDVTYPFARIKVIHVEDDVAIARLDKLMPAEEVPLAQPYAVMVGDVIRPAK